MEEFKNNDNQIPQDSAENSEVFEQEESIDLSVVADNIETAEATAKELDIDLIAVTGQQGKVGALAALGLYNDVEEAVKAYDQK